MAAPDACSFKLVSKTPDESLLGLFRKLVVSIDSRNFRIREASLAKTPSLSSACPSPSVPNAFEASIERTRFLCFYFMCMLCCFFWHATQGTPPAVSNRFFFPVARNFSLLAPFFPSFLILMIAVSFNISIKCSQNCEMEFVEGWDIVQVLGEGAFGEVSTKFPKL